MVLLDRPCRAIAKVLQDLLDGLSVSSECMVHVYRTSFSRSCAIRKKTLRISLLCSISITGSGNGISCAIVSETDSVNPKIRSRQV